MKYVMFDEDSVADMSVSIDKFLDYSSEDRANGVPVEEILEHAEAMLRAVGNWLERSTN